MPWSFMPIRKFVYGGPHSFFACVVTRITEEVQLLFASFKKLDTLEYLLYESSKFTVHQDYVCEKRPL